MTLDGQAVVDAKYRYWLKRAIFDPVRGYQSVLNGIVEFNVPLDTL